MCTPFQFPPRTLQQLKDSCPSRAQGRNWKSEIAYRDECIDVIQKTCEGLQIHVYTQQRAIVLLHRYFSATSSLQCTNLAKWSHAVACVFACQKLDSVYHRLQDIVHTSLVALRQLQKRQMEPEYYSPDGTPGNPAYLSSLAQMVGEAEMEVLLAVNFAMSISAPITVVGHHLRKLGLTEEAEMAYPDLAEKIHAVREEAVKTALACTGKGTAVVLMYPMSHISLAAVWRACKANKLQWYLKPDPKDNESNVEDENVPDLDIPTLKSIAKDLPPIQGAGSSLRKDPQRNDGHGCFRSRGGRWLSKAARKPALVKYEGGIRLSSNATGSSNGDAGTCMQHLCEPSPSPDSTNGPLQQPHCSAAAAGAVAAAGGCCPIDGSTSSSKQSRHVSFGELPPSVTILQAQFRQRAAVEEKYRRERSPEPCASLDSDQEDYMDQQQEDGSGGWGGCGQQLQDGGNEQQQQQRRVAVGLKRVRNGSVGLAAYSDEEDSAMSRPNSSTSGGNTQQQQRQGDGQDDDCAGSSEKRHKASSSVPAAC